MALTNLTWTLTALGAVVVLITRTRLRATEAQSGVTEVPKKVVNAHTVAGVIALVLWIWTLVGSPVWVGALALLAWWVVALVGLMILARWLPSAGSHSTDATDDALAQGPGLSILGHVGMLVGVAFFTWAFLADKI